MAKLAFNSDFSNKFFCCVSAEEDCPLFDKMAVGPTLDKITEDCTELDKMLEDCPALGLDIKLNESLLLEEPADVVVVLKY